MGLNKTEGETLPIIGKGVVAPIEKWTGVLEMLEIAAQHAANHFHEAGAPKNITLTDDNILIQEYHLLGRLVFLFQYDIRGETYYYPYTFKFGEQMLRELAMAGKWPVSFAMPMPTEAIH
jgi:hypothetical protein